MEATERRNYPYYIILGYTPLKGTLGILVVAPSDGCLAAATRLASTQALRSRRVSSASKSLDAPGSRLRPPSLRSWLCGSTKEPRRFCGEPPIPLMTWPPRRPGSTLVLRLNQETVPDFVLLFLPPCGPHLISFDHWVHRAEPTCLSTPRGPHRLRPLAPALHLHQRKSSRNLHLQYSA
jgi:hypothetical protein